MLLLGMHNHVIPNQYVTKVERLILYLKRSKPEPEVCADWDVDRRCASFRFDQNGRGKYLFKMSAEVL
jgi:hypothetical protein